MIDRPMQEHKDMQSRCKMSSSFSLQDPAKSYWKSYDWVTTLHNKQYVLRLLSKSIWGFCHS